jgi:hypothetical protein
VKKHEGFAREQNSHVETTERKFLEIVRPATEGSVNAVQSYTDTLNVLLAVAGDSAQRFSRRTTDSTSANPFQIGCNFNFVP